MKFLILFFLAFPVFADTLICFGDSQTAIRPPVQATDTYCYKMSYATGRGMLNKGIGGNTTVDALARISADVLTQTGSCVTVMFGAVDSYIKDSQDFSTWWASPKPSEVSIANYTTNLTSIVNQIKGAGKSVTLMTPWPTFGTANLNQGQFYSDAVKAVGRALGVAVLDAHDIMRRLWWGSKPWFTSTSNAPDLWTLIVDEQHPSALGHTKMAELCNQPQSIGACACTK